MTATVKKRRAMLWAAGSALTFGFGVYMHWMLSSPLRPTAAPNTTSAAAASGPAAVYPRGTWRLAPADLSNVLLRLAHVLITYEGSRPQLSFLNSELGWQPVAGTPLQSARSRNAALALASHIAGLALVSPADFAALAREHSEDATTRAWGGALGSVSASQLPPEVLDALATLRIGEVSRPVETAAGFHVFKLERPLAPDWVAGREIAVTYAGTIDPIAVDPSAAARSHADAQTLADSLYQRARQDPAGFAALATESSELASRALGGELGAFSTTDPGGEARVVEALSNLSIGQVSQPIDTPRGFRILQRTAVEGPRPYAIRRIAIERAAASPSANATPGARQPEALIAEIAEVVRRDPARFEAFAAEHCCRGVLEWDGARGGPSYTRALARSRVGDIVGPVDIPERGTLELIVRVEPTSAQRVHRAVEHRLPSPRTPDLEDFARNGAPNALGNVTRQMAGQLAGHLQLQAEIDQQLHRELNRLALELESGQDGEARVAALTRSRHTLYELLGDEQFLRFAEAADAFVAMALLQGSQ